MCGKTSCLAEALQLALHEHRLGAQMHFAHAVTQVVGADVRVGGQKDRTAPLHLSKAGSKQCQPGLRRSLVTGRQPRAWHLVFLRRRALAGGATRGARGGAADGPSPPVGAGVNVGSCSGWSACRSNAMISCVSTAGIGGGGGGGGNGSGARPAEASASQTLATAACSAALARAASSAALDGGGGA